MWCRPVPLWLSNHEPDRYRGRSSSPGTGGTDKRRYRRVGACFEGKLSYISTGKRFFLKEPEWTMGIRLWSCGLRCGLGILHRPVGLSLLMVLPPALRLSGSRSRRRNNCGFSHSMRLKNGYLVFVGRYRSLQYRTRAGPFIDPEHDSITGIWQADDKIISFERCR